MGLLGGALTGLGAGALFGTKPNVPPWEGVSLDQSQNQATAANEAALPGLEKLASGVNAFNQEELTTLFNSIMPGWSNMVSQSGKNISSELKGEIPTDVAQALQSSDAAKALTGGFGGSGLSGNLTARDLGLTSLNMMQQGQSSLESWSSMIDQMFAPGQFNIQSMFISPQQEFSASMENEALKFNRDWTSNQIAASPDPVVSGSFNTMMSFFKSYMGANA